TALAGRAAAELQAGAGIESFTIDGLLAAVRQPLSRGGTLQGVSVVVVDEAAMVGTRALAELLASADAAGTKVVLVGDHRQLPEIDAGGVFRGLAARLDPVELDTNRRQRAEWQREALAELRAGTVATAVQTLDAQGAVVAAASADEVRERLV